MKPPIARIKNYFLGNKNLLFACFLGAFILLFAEKGYSKHLVGGSITYKYLGTKNNGYLMYRVTVDMFRDCSDLSGAQFFDPTIAIAVYDRKADKNGDTVLTDTMYINLASDVEVQPPSSAKNCTVKPKSCIREGLYSDTLVLKPSTYGYYLVYQRCCRNTMINVPDNVGQTYFAIIPPTNIINTTPVFNAVPSPYFCAQDTISISYAATEPDGDSLVYALGWPTAGGNSTNNIIPFPANVYAGIPLAPYNPGFSFQYPMSKSGFASIDSATGVVTLFAPSVGRYAIAVDVYEYRNHKLISITRRDIQLITVGGCPKQQPPVRIPIVDSLSIDQYTGTTYKVEAGKRLSFNIRYKATNSNVTKFSASGFFSKPGNFGHQPTFNFVLDSGFATGYFNWQTTCKDGNEAPYVFTIEASDTGCPAKTTYASYKIYVLKGADHINGSFKVCKDTGTSIYSTNPPLKGDTLKWAVNGGSFKLGPNDSSITVNWGNSPNGTIRIISKNDAGCYSDTIVVDVKISPKPKTPAIIGPTITCTGFKIPYSVSGIAGLKYNWTVKGDSTVKFDDSTKKNLGIIWKLGESNLLSVSASSSSFCRSDSTLIKIKTQQASNDSIIGDTVVCPNASGVPYFATRKPNTIYYWKIIGGTQVSGGNTYQIRVNWGNKGIGYVELHEDFPNGCAGDTIILKVVKDYVLKTSPISGRIRLCEQSAGITYSVKGLSNNYTYVWQVTNGKIVSGNGTQNITVDWGNAGTGKLIVTKTAYDSVNHSACASAPVSLNVTLLPIPNPSEISGPTDICQNDSAIYKVTGSTGNGFTWKINGVDIGAFGDSIVVQGKNVPSNINTLNIQVSDTTNDSCHGPTRSLILTIHRLTDTANIIGPMKICIPDNMGVIYYIKGIPKSTYKWTVYGGVITSGDTTDHITVNWTNPGDDSIKLVEINDLGCPLAVKTLHINMDSMAIKMNLVTTEEQNDKIIDLFWTPLNNQYQKRYFRIYRETEGQSFFRVIDSIPKTQYFYTDKNVNTSLDAYRYKIGVQNSCGNLTASDIHHSIKLNGNFDGDSLIHLAWNKYEGWLVDNYSVNNFLNTDTAISFLGFTGDSTYLVVKTNDGYRECFRVGAKEAGTKNVVSWSNKTCVEYDPTVWIPNVFTPNGDDHNETYHVFSRNYKTYQLDIYNRWGEHIFTSNDPSKQWDGKFNGNDCPEGVYLYIINLDGVKRNIYKSGTVTLIR